MIHTTPTDDRTTGHGPRHGDPAWVRALVLGPAVVGSFCVLVLLNHGPAVPGGLRRLLAWARAEPSPATLRAALLGRSKQDVMARFGPPPANTGGSHPTWYYPVAGPGHVAMAVAFADDVAVAVDLIHPPA